METLPKHPAMVKCEYHINITMYTKYKCLSFEVFRYQQNICTLHTQCVLDIGYNFNCLPLFFILWRYVIDLLVENMMFTILKKLNNIKHNLHTIHHTPEPQTRKTQTDANTETNLRNKWFNHWMVLCNTQSFVRPSPFAIHNDSPFNKNKIVSEIQQRILSGLSHLYILW